MTAIPSPRPASIVALLIPLLFASCAEEKKAPGSATALAVENREPGVDPEVGAEGIPGETSLKARTKRGIDKGLRYLRGLQASDGTWRVQGHPEPGVTALAVTAFLRSPRAYSSADGPFLRKPLDYLAGLARDDGGIYDQGLANYVTCVAMMALIESGEDRFQPLVKQASGFLRTLQADEGEGYSETDKFYGGMGYGGDERPDLSNASLWFDAMKASGTRSDDEAYRKAMVFLDRCQNRSESNPEEWKDPRTGVVFAAGNDGGATYAPGDSPAGSDTDARGRQIPRSYGSMTYALLKCYLVAGVRHDDARVEALAGWISRNYTLDVNPGFPGDADGRQGLFYYYLNLGRALEVYGKDVVQDASGQEHRWREELAEKLLSLQGEDGSWVNTNPRWWEGLPMLCTAYAILTLEICHSGL
jgi:squalene-hopene/tetraprenyl-beta-curcumene cyclase